jgi:polyferredoxin
VCPTGIDIRNGIQLKCVSCTACIDACNGVMRRVGRQPGLIRHTSADAIVSAVPRVTWWSTRVAAYGVVWMALVATVITLLVMRPGLDVLILRQPGTMYATVAGGDLANFYTVQALNRTGRPAAFAIEVVEPHGATVTLLGPTGQVDAYGVAETRILVRVPSRALIGASTPVTFAVQSQGRVVQQVASAFLGPSLRPARAGRE